MAGPTTAGYAALAEGEDWHYVGETGEPAWESSAWQNLQSDWNLGFRIRESGIVDIQGVITGAADPPTFARVFRLPEGYRPSANSYYPAVGRLTTSDQPVAVLIKIDTDGYVVVEQSTNSPYTGHGTTLWYVFLSVQAFLDPVSAP